MGNILVGSAPTAIHPIEYYLNDVIDFEFIKSLGSTRFFKVAKCHHYEGDCVVKILAFEDPSLPLVAHKNKIEKLSRETIKNVSIAGFHRVSIYTNFAMMARQYIKYSLYDRLSTRPFLSHLEKCWIAFQCFKCLESCHSKGITHGDLKLENILITSYLWVVIADFATYKPVYLPDDNPTDFSYFFDTSRRRCCNIAPERFLSDYSSQTSSAPSSTASELMNESFEQMASPQMDMFSIGCVIAELFSDDAPNSNLFDLGNLLRYKVNQYYPEKAINSIKNEEIRKLVENLINLEPLKRYSSTKVIQELTPSVFPSYFEILYDYLKQLVRLPPDAKIIRLSQDIDSLLAPILDEQDHGLLIILVIITSSIRSLKHCHCKLLAQRVICKIISSTTSSSSLSTYIIDRILPYLLDLLSDSDPRVRAEGIHSITNSLEQVTNLPQSDNNVFTDYILPILTNVSNDQSVLVRISLAMNISRLAKTAHNFLTQSCDHNYDDELTLLHETFQLIVSRLLIDSSNCVRRSLLSSSENCADLCVFFGRQKTNDVILSHIITFLNDKSDFQLRMSFFDNIVIIASFLGNHSSQILQPLLQQGFSDSEEIIISKSIDAISSLIQQGLLNKQMIYQLVNELMPLISHPNLWIKNSLIQLIQSLTTKLSLADINCKVLPILDFHLKIKIHSINNPCLLVDSLNEPIPRPIYDLIVNSKQNCDSLFDLLFKRNISNINNEDNTFYVRLVDEGLTETMEKQILKLSDILKKINSNKKSQQSRNKLSGHVSLSASQKNTNNRFGFSITLIDNSNEDKGFSKRQLSATMNDEWMHMFSSKIINENNNFNLNTNVNDEQITNIIPIAHEAKEQEMTLHIQCPPCRVEINKLIIHKKNSHKRIAKVKPNQSSLFRPKGILVAHFQEHSSGVNRLINIENSSHFASCSSDGTIKLWDCSRIEGKSLANRSKQTYQIQNASFGGITFCKNCIIGYTNTNQIHVLQVFENGSTKLKLLNNFEIESEISNTTITDITTISDNVFSVSLSDSNIYGYDIRLVNNTNQLKPIWKLTTQAHERLINCITGNDYVLFAGTSRGLIITFDLRFLIRSNTFNYPNQIRIRRLLISQNGLYSAGQGNSEVSLWDCESGSRIRTMWASNAPALSLTQSSAHSVLGMVLSGKDNSSLITCGTDMKIRYWDCARPEQSYIINENLKTTNHQNVKYSSKFIEGIQVIQECKQDSSSEFSSTTTKEHSDQLIVSPSHRDSISDIIRVNNNLLVSASKDGIVKVWK